MNHFSKRSNIISLEQITLIKFQEIHNTKALFLSNIKGVLNGRENITERPQLIAQAMKIKEIQCLDNKVYNPKLKKRNSIKHTKESFANYLCKYEVRIDINKLSIHCN